MTFARLIDHMGKHRCGHPGCREKASSLVLCLACKAVLARCLAHGRDMLAVRESHCQAKDDLDVSRHSGTVPP